MGRTSEAHLCPSPGQRDGRKYGSRQICWQGLSGEPGEAEVAPCHKAEPALPGLGRTLVTVAGAKLPTKAEGGSSFVLIMPHKT